MERKNFLKNPIGHFHVLAEKDNPAETFMLELRELVSITNYRQENINQLQHQKWRTFVYWPASR